MARIAVITTPELASGFALTGADVRAATNVGEAERLLRQYMAEAPDSIIAYHQPYYAVLTPDLRERVALDYHPLVVALPDGFPARGEISRQALLSQMLSRVIGFSITFKVEE
jgi:vacuolar-type H+-ATPase subunit F/Vma7